MKHLSKAMACDAFGEERQKPQKRRRTTSGPKPKLFDGNWCARGGLELPTFWFVAEQGQNLSACSGVAYGPTDDALTRTTRPR